MLSREQLPFSKYEGKMINTKLSDDLLLDQWIIPKETEIKLQTTRNFGWIILPEACQDKRDFTIPRRIFKY